MYRLDLGMHRIVARWCRLSHITVDSEDLTTISSSVTSKPRLINQIDRRCKDHERVHKVSKRHECRCTIRCDRQNFFDEGRTSGRECDPSQTGSTPTQEARTLCPACSLTLHQRIRVRSTQPRTSQGHSIHKHRRLQKSMLWLTTCHVRKLDSASDSIDQRTFS